jgi:hypothetical protein
MLEFLLFGIAAASWQTAHLYYATSKIWMANRGASPLNLFIRKKFNDPTSYRIGEASRAHPKGLALLPNISPSEMYQVTIRLLLYCETNNLIWNWKVLKCPMNQSFSDNTEKISECYVSKGFR